MMQVDWPATHLQNLLMDYDQTCYFARHGIEEINPLWKDMVKRKDYTLLAAGWAVGGALIDSMARRSRLVYPIVGAVQLIIVGLNAKRHGVGFPIVTVRF